MSKLIGAITGYIFTVVTSYIVLTLVLDVFTPATSLGFGTTVWLFLFVWRNLGGGNPVRNRVNYLRQQIEYANEDIDELTNQRVPGYKAETRFLRTKIKEYEREIEDLNG